MRHDSVRRQRLRSKGWAALESVRGHPVPRAGLGSVLLLRGATRFARGQRLEALSDFLAIQRTVRISPLSRWADRASSRVLATAAGNGADSRVAIRENLLHEFRESPRAKSLVSKATRLRWLDAVTLQGDLLLLKEPDPDGGELGVLLIKYNPAFYRFAATYDVGSVLERYQIVLEPSWVGYAVPEFFFFLDERRHVLVQAHLESDYRYLASLATNLLPIRLCNGYWVDESVFRPLQDVSKRYAAIQVANWAPFKRHHLLIRALREVRDPSIRVALAGFPWQGFTREWIEDEIERQGVTGQVDLFERLPPRELNELYNASRINLVLSRKEGAPKALYEGFFAGVPCAVSAGHESIRLDDVNEHTGVQVADRDLATLLRRVAASELSFRPLEWAGAHFSATRSIRVVEDALRRCATDEGHRWYRPVAEKVNRPNLRYRTDELRHRMRPHYRDLASFLRFRPKDLDQDAQ